MKNKGSSAQCIAQATDVAMPNPSRLIFSFMLWGEDNNYASKLQNNYLAFKLRIFSPGGANFAKNFK